MEMPAFAICVFILKRHFTENIILTSFYTYIYSEYYFSGYSKRKIRIVLLERQNSGTSSECTESYLIYITHYMYYIPMKYVNHYTFQLPVGVQ